jgi:predicted naringenin-chalcone synthase
MPLPLFLPSIAAVFLGALGRILTSRVGIILFQLGFAAVTFTGVTVGLGALKSDILGFLAQLPGTMVTILSLMRIDQGILILFSAMAAKLAYQAVNGAVTRWITRAPPGAG